MQFVKQNLKSARTAISANKFEEALYYAEAVLEIEPSNYNALLFVGVAAQNLNEPGKSFQAYDNATKFQPDNPSAWKGLTVLHRSQNDGLQYLDAFVGLMGAFNAKTDRSAGHDALLQAMKYINSTKDEEVRKRFYQLELPGSPIFDFMEPHLPKPTITFERLIKIFEAEESQKVNKSISKSRFKVGAKSVKTDQEGEDATKYKIYKESHLPGLYNGLINSTFDDELRKSTEGKLLRYIYNFLRVAPADEKPPMKRDAAEMSNGMVVVKSPEALAWKLDIDWQDPKDLKDLDYDTISYYAAKFNDPSARTLQAFLHSDISPFMQQKKKEKGEIPVLEDGELAEGEDTAIQSEEWTPVTVLETISDGFENDPDFVLGYRVLGQLYLHNREYESAADVARKGIQKITNLQKSTLTEYVNGGNHLLVILGTAYTYYQAPKNFDKAIALFDIVLKHTPDYCQALIGKGLILVGRGKLTEAEKLLSSVYTKYPDNFQALFELSWCQVLQGNHDDGLKGLKTCLTLITGSDPESLDYRAKIWWRIGNSYWNTRDEEGHATEAFNAFVKTLQENPNYAPAYTSLGFFYSDIVDDKVRATKCFYKAFELDGGEIDAAFQLATEFADNSEWNLVEIVATRTIESERLRTFSNKEASWPYRALGIAGLNKRDFAQAVKYFQSSLRLAPRDGNSWIGLGEAYKNSGRYAAAAKAFDRALALNPENWISQYQLGIVKREVCEYDEAIAAFEAVLENHPDEDSIRVALIESYLLSAQNNLENDFYSRAISRGNECITAALSAVEAGVNTQDLWKCVGDACELYLIVSSQEHKVNLEELVTLLSMGCDLTSLPFEETEDIHQALLKFSVLAYEISLQCCRRDMSSRAAAHYNLGLGHLRAFTRWEGGEVHRDEALEQLKRAIKLEHRNAEFWNAYGIASSSLNARVAQHCFIRSLTFNIAQPAVWANLGALYILHGDLELAEEVFDKTQSLDPEKPSAWMGHGIIESVKGNKKQSESLFAQAHLISQGSVSLAKLLYGLAVLEREKSGEQLIKGSRHELESAVLALQKYLMGAPNSDLALALQGMLLERENMYDEATTVVSHLCDLLEQRYEESETDEDLAKFARAKAHLARLYLGVGNYEEAIGHSQFVADIAAGDANLTNCVTSALLTSGLGLYFANDLDASIECFKNALELTNEDQDVVVLLAQVLWAHGGETEKEVALDQLYASIGAKGASLKITLLLGAIGLADDSDLVEAAREELENLSLEDMSCDMDSSVQEVLSSIDRSKEAWQRAAFLWPSNSSVWKNLDMNVALQLAKSKNSVATAKELSDAYAAKATVEASQTAVFYAPWNTNAWASLARALS